jgi:hypothetical protein
MEHDLGLAQGLHTPPDQSEPFVEKLAKNPPRNLRASLAYAEKESPSIVLCEESDGRGI